VNLVVHVLGCRRLEMHNWPSQIGDKSSVCFGRTTRVSRYSERCISVAGGSEDAWCLASWTLGSLLVFL
jgi:hypothetical protein